MEVLATLKTLLAILLLFDIVKAQDKVIKDAYPSFNDPLWNEAWYLHDDFYPSMNVQKAWKEGYTGEGVVVTVVDDGIEHEHPDLAANYDRNASYDFNSQDSDPAPRYTAANDNRHGTRMAGLISAAANNSVCTAGVAFKSRIGGIRMLDGNVDDEIESQAFGFANDYIDIYVASFGPDDDGWTVDGPGELTEAAFKKAIAEGRKGKGSIFVWSAGNGGRYQDDCNCDGYANSMHTITISSVNDDGRRPWYGERCSAILAVTYSSGSTENKAVATTDLRRGCTTQSTGTGPSVSLAAGIIALTLQANPNLTWRDLQHLIVKTSNMDGLHDDNITMNGAGRKVSRSFGFGLMDAHAMVREAKSWKTAPQQRVCRVTIKPEGGRRDWDLSHNYPTVMRVVVNASSCDDGGELPDRLEHVQLTVSTIKMLRYTLLSVRLLSPKNTTSVLLDYRRGDNYYRGFKNWNFLSTQFWDENPSGMWEVTFERQEWGGRVFQPLVLNLYGTMETDWQAPEPVTTTSAKTTTTTKMSDEKRRATMIRVGEYIACVTKCSFHSFFAKDDAECSCKL